MVRSTQTSYFCWDTKLDWYSDQLPTWWRSPLLFCSPPSSSLLPDFYLLLLIISSPTYSPPRLRCPPVQYIYTLLHCFLSVTPPRCCAQLADDKELPILSCEKIHRTSLLMNIRAHAAEKKPYKPLVLECFTLRRRPACGIISKQNLAEREKTPAVFM